MRSLAVLALVLGLGQEPRKEETVLRAAWPPPSEIDPHRATSLAESRYVTALFEGLTTHEADGVTVAPGMAEGWEAGPDGLTWTFRLREAKWSNGDAITAQDFVWAWRRAVRPGSGSPFRGLFRVIRHVGAYLDGAEADLLLAQLDELPAAAQGEAAARLVKVACRRHAEPLRRRGRVEAARAAETRPDADETDLGFAAADARTLRVTLERRAPFLPDLLAFMVFVPLHEKSISAAGAGWVQPGRIVTNGPYLFEGATPLGITLRRNPRYWDAALAAAPDQVVTEFHSEDVSLERFRQGKVDWVVRDRIPAAKAAEQKDLVRYDTWGTFYLLLNAARPPFDRPGVRRAFARGVDRRRLAEAAASSPATSLVPAGFRGYPAAEGHAFDGPGAIEALLKESEFDLFKFPKVEILTADGLRAVAVGQLLCSHLEKTLGVAVTLRPMKWPAFARSLAAGEYAAALGSRAGDTFDPAAFLEAWRKGDPENSSGWGSAEYDALLRSAAEEPDGAKRLELLAKAEGILLSEAPVVPLLWAGDGYLAGPRLSGLQPNLMSRFPLKHLRIRP